MQELLASHAAQAKVDEQERAKAERANKRKKPAPTAIPDGEVDAYPD